MSGRARRTTTFAGIGVLVLVLLVWQLNRLQNPLAGVWEDEAMVCSFGRFGDGECADKDLGTRSPARLGRGSRDLTIGCHTGSYELWPGGEGFVWRVTGLVSGPCIPVEPKWLRQAQAEAQTNGTYLGAPTYARLKTMFGDRRLDAAGQVVTMHLHRARYGDGNVMRMGVPSRDEDLTLEQMAAVLEGDSYGKELGTAAALEALELARNGSFGGAEGQVFRRRR